MSTKGINILVCGSKDFDDANFVCGFLDMINATMEIETVISGNFTGVSKYAKEWAENNNISYKSKEIFSDMDYAFFDHASLPDALLKTNKSFMQGVETIISLGVNMIMPFPNNKGEYGVTTSNILKVKKLIPSVAVFDISKETLCQLRESIGINSPTVQQQNQTSHRRNIKGLGHI